MSRYCKPWQVSVMALLLVILAGCASSPETRYYTLMSASQTLQPGQAIPGHPLTVTRVQMPEYLDGQRLWVRSEPHQLQAMPYVRWAEPLPRAVTRSLQQHLGASADVQGQGQRLLVDLDSFEARWADQEGEDRVVMTGYWQLAGEESPAQRITLQAPLADRRPGSLVAAQSRLLEQLAEDISTYRKRLHQ